MLNRTELIAVKVNRREKAITRHLVAIDGGISVSDLLRRMIHERAHEQGIDPLGQRQNPLRSMSNADRAVRQEHAVDEC